MGSIFSLITNHFATVDMPAPVAALILVFGWLIILSVVVATALFIGRRHGGQSGGTIYGRTINGKAASVAATPATSNLPHPPMNMFLAWAISTPFLVTVVYIVWFTVQRGLEFLWNLPLWFTSADSARISMFWVLAVGSICFSFVWTVGIVRMFKGTDHRLATVDSGYIDDDPICIFGLRDVNSMFFDNRSFPRSDE